MERLIYRREAFTNLKAIKLNFQILLIVANAPYTFSF